MSSQRLTRDEIRRAQELVGRIQGISSCQISVNESGEITEVHVVAKVDKPPKLIARDVESCLKAEMGVDVDHRKIGVVLFDTVIGDSERPTIDPAPVLNPPGDSVVEFPVEEYASRFEFRSVNLFITQGATRAEVELGLDHDTAFGSAGSDRPNQTSFDVIAEATLAAVSEYLDESTRLCLGGVRRVNVDDAYAIFVKVDVLNGRDRKSLAGASMVTSDENQTVVFATLDAVNRLLGKLEFKSAVEYRIK
jgi:hypothetical protein